MKMSLCVACESKVFIENPLTNIDWSGDVFDKWINQKLIRKKKLLTVSFMSLLKKIAI